jgi:hypothetical protein
MWLPGDVQVATVGETFYQDAIAAAAAGIAQGLLPVATLVPEPDNQHDKFAVGVLNGRPAGHLPRDVAQRVQLTIRAFMDANGGRPPACPASRSSQTAQAQAGRVGGVDRVAAGVGVAGLGLADCGVDGEELGGGGVAVAVAEVAEPGCGVS